MYESIQGLVSHLTPTYAVITANGIGYKIQIPVNLFTHNLSQGNQCLLFTSLVVREDDMRLYGFISREDRDLFELLLSLSGIGGKTALSIIGHITPNDLHLAIETGDVPLLCRIPGIGKKSAERLILELKGRTKGDGYVPLSSGQSLTSDATLALIGLGYNQKSAEMAVKKALEKGAPPKLSELIAHALKAIYVSK